VGNNLSNDISNDLFTNTNRHKVTVTRRRKIKPTSSMATNHRERITRKKLVTVRPVPEPTSTLAIITTGFYTIPSVEEDEDEDYYENDDSKIPTPNLYTLPFTENNPIPILSTEAKKSILNLEKPSSTSDPIIITDNFFFPPIYEELTTIENKDELNEETTTTINDFTDGTTVSDLVIDNISSNSTDNNITTEREIETITNTFDETDATYTPIYDDDSTILIDNEVTTKNPVTDNDMDNINRSNETDKNEQHLNFTIITTPRTLKMMKANINDTGDGLKIIPITVDFNENVTAAPTETFEKELLSSTNNLFESKVDLQSSEVPTVIPLEVVSSFNKELSEIQIKPTSTLELQVTTSLPPLTPEDIEAGLTDDLYLSLSRPDFPQIIPSEVGTNINKILVSNLNQYTPELQTSVYYSETIVTSTRLRTYTYVVTKLNGQDTEVKSSTTVRPRVTSLTLTVPVTVTVTPTMISSSVAFNSSLGKYLSNHSNKSF
jgi:hypothetical protein